MGNAEKIAVVTGANRGIGLEIARQLGRAGLRVVLGSRDEEAGRRRAAELGAQGIQVEPRRLDVTRDDDVEALARALEAQGGLDVLVNNAGIAMNGFDAEVARTTLDVNFFGALRLTERLLPLLRHGARVVMISSGLGDSSSLSEPLRRTLK